MTQPVQQQKNQSGALMNTTRAVQQFIADVLTPRPDKIYRLDDYDVIRTSIFDNVKDAISRRFPLRNDKFTLGVEDLEYDDPDDIDLEEQKRMLLNNKSSTRRLRGCWVLRDAVNDKEIGRTRRMTLMHVPRMTSRGTFIKNGKEYNLTNIMRLEPGVYCKQKPDSVAAQFNIKQGTGSGFNMILNPNTGVFTIKRGTTNAPAYTVLRDMGVTDEQLKEQWGEDIFNTNRNAGMTNKAREAADKIYNM